MCQQCVNVETKAKQDLKVFGRPRPTPKEYETEERAAFERQREQLHAEESDGGDDREAADDLHDMAADAAASEGWA